jgi:hypothetical protein
MISGESVLFGVMAIATMWKSSISMEKGAVKVSKLEALVPPVHPGEILREDFMKPLALTVNRLALDCTSLLPASVKLCTNAAASQRRQPYV